MKIYYCILCITLLMGCETESNKKTEVVDEINSSYVFYSDSITGWSTQYPDSWSVLTDKEIEAIENRGREILDPNASENSGTNNQLLWLRKDDFNSFTSNYTFFKPEDGVYEEVELAIFQMIELSYTKMGLHVNSKIDRTMLDGLEFIRWQAVIMTADRSDTVMNQIMYCRLIDNQASLLLNVNYNNQADRDLLLKIIESSRFTNR